MNRVTQKEMDKKIDEDAINKQVELNRLARAERKKNPPPELIHLQQTTSLKDWLERCTKANVPYIPAKFCPISIAVKDIFDILDGKKASDAVLLTEKWLMKTMREENGGICMWRWDLCAPHSIKWALSESKKWNISSKLELDDPRFIDILMDSHRDYIDVCVRPWATAEYYECHPVEFRVFAFRNSYQNEYSVSSYYPQRDLPTEYYDYAVECEKLASKLSQTENFENGFTADFMLTAERKLVFIEGGPAWGYGADPCCIAPNKMEPGRIVLENEFER